MGSGCGKPQQRKYELLASYVTSSEPDDVAAFPDARTWRASQPPWKGRPRVLRREPERQADVKPAPWPAPLASELQECAPAPAPPAAAAAAVAAAAAAAAPSPAAAAAPSALLDALPEVAKHWDVKLSKRLTKLLRHQALEARIDIDRDGWALVADVLQRVNAKEQEEAVVSARAAPELAAARASEVSIEDESDSFVSTSMVPGARVRSWGHEDVCEVVRLSRRDGKKRFELRDTPSGSMIRASE